MKPMLAYGVRSAWAWVGLLLAFAAAASAAPVAYDVHDGYFVSNRFEPDAPSSFVVLRDQAAFDLVFGAAFVMRDRAHRLPPDVFATHLVVSAIHRGKAMVTYQVRDVAAEGKALVVRYTTKVEPSDTAEFACPLILSVARGEYDEVRFVENGKEIKRLAMRPAAALRVTCREPETLAATNEGAKTALIVRGGSGIGGGTVSRGDGPWPEELVVRAHLRGLEHLAIAGGGVTLAASVLSHGNQERRLHLIREGKEGPPLGKDSPYWMDIRAFDAEGTPTPGLPPPGGWFELTLPPALLPAAGDLTLDWIDFYR